MPKQSIAGVLDRDEEKAPGRAWALASPQMTGTTLRDSDKAGAQINKQYSLHELSASSQLRDTQNPSLRTLYLPPLELPCMVTAVASGYLLQSEQI
jgi:hypothetical protein